MSLAALMWLVLAAAQVDPARPAADAEAARQRWWALGTSEYQKDRFTECRDAFRHLTELAPKAGPAVTMLGLCESGARQYDAAIEHLQQGQDLGAVNEAIDKAAKYQLARLYTSRGMFESALAVIAQLATITEEKPAYILLSGVAALWKPMFPEDVPSEDRELVYLAGKAFWHAGARNAGDAERMLQELAAKYPAAPGVHYLYGAFELRNDPDRAVAEFERELQITPGHVGALSALAAEYLRRKEAEKGLPYARELAAALPDAVASHALLGRLLADKGDLKEGVRELEKARTLDPNDPQPHIALASVYAQLGRKEDAARERQEFIRLKGSEKKPAER